MSKKIEIFGKYALLKKIADGGMAEVFLARPAVQEGDGRLLVIKRILPHIANNPEFVNMFQHEIQTTLGFSHANVVQLQDFGAVKGQPYIAMEYIEGKSIREIVPKLVEKHIKMPVPVALSIIAQAAAGLHYAHTFTHKTNGKSFNVVHRDISPHNLLLSYEGNLKVIDFGIAKAANGAQEATQTGTVKGKAAYFSPEQLFGHKVDARSDIFSLGIVAWELLTGQRLFVKPGESEANIMMKVSQCEKHVVRPSTLNKDVTFEVDDLIMRALEKDPARRFKDAREFQAELRRILIGRFPNYHYADTGRLVSILFAEEKTNERLQTNALNTRAQEMLGEMSEEELDLALQASAPLHPVNTKLTNRVDGVAFRLSKLESELSQKARGRHYAMLAFYIVSLFVLKFGDRYSYWFDLSSQKARATEVARANVQVPVVATIPAIDPSTIAATTNTQAVRVAAVSSAISTARMPSASQAISGQALKTGQLQPRSQIRPITQVAIARTQTPHKGQNTRRGKPINQQQ